MASLVAALDNHAIHINGPQNQKLKISFQRTVRVPDNGRRSQPPPGLENFSLYRVREYANKLPQDMKSNGGLFLPMYRECSETLSLEATL